MTTKEDRSLAERIIRRLNRYDNGSPAMIEALAEAIEGVHIAAYDEGYRKGFSDGHKGKGLGKR